jgi:hypothetical protein
MNEHEVPRLLLAIGLALWLGREHLSSRRWWTATLALGWAFTLILALGVLRIESPRWLEALTIVGVPIGAAAACVGLGNLLWLGLGRPELRA